VARSFTRIYRGIRDCRRAGGLHGHSGILSAEKAGKRNCRRIAQTRLLDHRSPIYRINGSPGHLCAARITRVRIGEYAQKPFCGATGLDMLSDAMENTRSASFTVPLPTAPEPSRHPDEYPDKLDAALFRIAGVCSLACIMAVLDSTVVAVAQRTFIEQFGSTQAIVSWTIAGYMLAFATVIPITGWAADRFGTKRLFMSSVLAFALGSLLCAMAPNILLLIVFRVLQGTGGGMLLPLSWMILTREAGPKRVGRLMASGGIPILLGPIGGPILGGWLIDAYGWKWIFLVNLPIGLVTLVLAAILFAKDCPAPSEALDVTGLLLLSPGVAIFLCGVSAIPGRHTIADRFVLVPVLVGFALIIAFSLHAWHRADHPLIDLRLFKNPAVTQVNVTLLVFAAASV